MDQSNYKVSFIQKATQGATQAGHIFPQMAACEAALESAYGISGLAISANNLFGMKQHTHPIFGTLALPTKEFLDGAWKPVEAYWVKYPDLAACFEDRMATLQRLAPHYIHYAAALAAPDPLTYVVAVSQSWSTDPQRANKVIAIYHEYFPS